MKRRKLSDKFPCTCGHMKYLHSSVGPPIGEEWCNAEIKIGKFKSLLCDCYCYKPDNLKFLEQQSNKKKRGNKS
jgi:hypothetical protein